MVCSVLPLTDLQNIKVNLVLRLNGVFSSPLNRPAEHRSEISKPHTGDVFYKMKELRIANPKKVIIGHLNINSIPNMFEGIMNLVGETLDVFLISETKVDDSFPDAPFSYPGYAKPQGEIGILAVAVCSFMYMTIFPQEN